MAVISRPAAADRIGAQLERMERDDLVEVYNELQPDAPAANDLPPNELLATIQKHFSRGLEAEEIVDLWNVVFPEDNNVWFDEQEDTVHYNDEPQQVESSE